MNKQIFNDGQLRKIIEDNFQELERKKLNQKIIHSSNIRNFKYTLAEYKEFHCSYLNDLILKFQINS